MGLLVCGGVAVWLRREALDGRMLRMLIGLATAMVVTFLTNFKEGTGLNIAVPVEAALVPLAVVGTVFAVRAGRFWIPVAACAAAWLFTLAQSAALMISPGRPEPFLRTGSANAWYELLGPSRLRAAATAARACADGVPYSGPPLIAFVAGRPMPGGQPDQFIIAHAPTLASFRARIAAVQRVCP